MNRNESKKEKFIRLAEARTNKILNMMRLLGNCSNKNNYEYTEQDIQKIFNTLERELKNTKAKFNIREENKDDKFTLR
ncbi:hypothetical protein [Allisonella histaminiformans]|uniref:hypothetical protein n=1 Tax=Allisonella histaminiformans TaxID=209880 RepID=UPI00307D0AAD